MVENPFFFFFLNSLFRKSLFKKTYGAHNEAKKYANTVKALFIGETLKKNKNVQN